LESELHPWVVDFASISSIVGVFVAFYILRETADIKKSFLRKARLPEISKELKIKSKNISSGLKSWGTEKNTVNEQYAIVRGLLENITNKLPDDERKQVTGFINSLKIRYWIFLKKSLVIDEENKGWELYGELSRIITRLEQLQKDSKWE